MSVSALYRFLIVAQVIGTSVAVILSIVDVETIVGSGPILSVIGLVVAFAGLVKGNRAAILFGLSATAMSLFLFALINRLRWGPSEASLPVSIILLVYEGFMVPLGLVALYGALIEKYCDSTKVRWQFSMRALFLGVACSAIGFAIARLAYELGSEAMMAFAIVACVATISGTLVVAHFAARHGVELAAEESADSTE